MLITITTIEPGRVAQSVGHLTRKSGVLGSIPGLATYFRFSFCFFSRRAVVSYLRKYVHEVLVNRLGGLSLPRKSVVRLTDCPDMTLDVYRGRKTTIQQQQQQRLSNIPIDVGLFQYKLEMMFPSVYPIEDPLIPLTYNNFVVSECVFLYFRKELTESCM